MREGGHRRKRESRRGGHDPIRLCGLRGRLPAPLASYRATVRPEGGADRWPTGARAVDPTTPPPQLSVAVGRALGIVVVTVRGVLDGVGSVALEHVLTDLIEDQGNLALVVDLKDTTALGPEALAVLLLAAQRARRHGGRFILTSSVGSDQTWRELQASALADDVESSDRLSISCSSSRSPARLAKSQPRPSLELRPADRGDRLEPEAVEPPLA
ncbi:MAG: STAS domain-containing protein [Acidimicrobiales bacterium]